MRTGCCLRCRGTPCLATAPNAVNTRQVKCQFHTQPLRNNAHARHYSGPTVVIGQLVCIQDTNGEIVEARTTAITRQIEVHDPHCEPLDADGADTSEVPN